MSSLFARIITGEIPSHRVATTARWIAFLDIHPAAPGHVLVVPVHGAQFIADLPAETLSELGGFLKRTIAAVKHVTGAPAVNVMINDGPEAGQEVPHAHLHIIPRRAGDGQKRAFQPHPATGAELAALAVLIAEQWQTSAVDHGSCS